MNKSQSQLHHVNIPENFWITEDRTSERNLHMLDKL